MLVFSLLMTVFTVGPGAFAQSAANEDGIKAAINTLKYVRGLGNEEDSLSFGVVFDPSNAGSKSEAEKARAVIASIKKGGTIGLVPVTNLGAAGRVDVFYVVSQMSQHYSTIKSYALSNKIFNISLDDECARSSCCLIAIKQKGSHMDVLMNNQALRSAGFDVEAILRYMAVTI